VGTQGEDWTIAGACGIPNVPGGNVKDGATNCFLRGSGRGGTVVKGWTAEKEKDRRSTKILAGLWGEGKIGCHNGCGPGEDGYDVVPLLDEHRGRLG